MDFIILFPYMHIKYIDHIHPYYSVLLLSPLLMVSLQTVPILHSEHFLFYIIPMLCTSHVLSIFFSGTL
jgi:hypothetical protein